jgi:tetratricopeptide (TPR) repeat protein
LTLDTNVFSARQADMDNRLITHRTASAILAAVVLLAGLGTADAGPLTDAQRDGYLIWLQSLETTTGAQAPATPFPLGLLPGAVAMADSGALRDVALSLDEIESRPVMLQEPAGRSPLHALTRARNHMSLAEYDSALVWYAKAADRDAAGDHGDALALETMVAAVAADDSVTVVRQTLSVLGVRDLAAHGSELELAYRFFIARGDSANLGLLVQEAAAHADAVTGRLAFWQAFALSSLGRWDESLDWLRGLIVAGGLSHGLDEGQRRWVLVAVPDLLYLGGQTDQAAALYGALAQADLGDASRWATCQVGALDFLAGRYLDAGTAFERLCDGPADATWRAYACSMADLSDEMERLRNEGESHGAAAYFQR